MKRYKVLKNGIVTNAWTSDFAGADHREPSFGKEERWVNEIELSEEEKAAALDSKTEEALGESVTLLLLPAEFEIIEEDITEELAQTTARAQATALLAATDWYIIREMDTGIACPAEIKAQRAAAREVI